MMTRFLPRLQHGTEASQYLGQHGKADARTGKRGPGVHLSTASTSFAASTGGWR